MDRLTMSDQQNGQHTAVKRPSRRAGDVGSAGGGCRKFGRGQSVVTGFHSADRTLRGETACEPTGARTLHGPYLLAKEA